MDSITKDKKRKPHEAPNFLSYLSTWWSRKLLWKSASGKLTLQDMFEAMKCDESELLGNKLEREWNVELKKSLNKKTKNKKINPSFKSALIRTFFWENAFAGILQGILSIVIRPMQPFLIKNILGSLGKNENENDSLWYTGGLYLNSVLLMLTMHHSTFLSQRLGMRMRIACCSLIYRKVLRLNTAGLDRTAAGQIVNLMSNDVARFDHLPIFINYIVIVPFQLIVMGYLMWKTAGLVFLVGLGTVILILIPFQGCTFKIIKPLRAKITSLTDKRLHLMNEIVAGIKLVKMFAWEKPFGKMVSSTRADEIKSIGKRVHIQGIHRTLALHSERVSLFLTLISFVLLGNALTAETSYTLSTLFCMLMVTTALFLSQALLDYAESKVSVKRIQDFLLLDELATSNEDNLFQTENGKLEKSEPNSLATNPVRVELMNVYANWITGTLPPTLNNVSMQVDPGKLCAIIGSVGSGKSSVLSLLLKELPLRQGTVILSQEIGARNCDNNNSIPAFHQDNKKLQISYSSQDAWIFSGSVKDNILFGQLFDPKRYKTVLEACALVEDIKRFSHGDETMVGERGIILSGGQKARIDLARAVYRQADIYLLDDPLSAVDTRVGKHVFEKCILEFLKDKTRILVTHQLQFLQHVDTIVVLEQGTVEYQGTYDNVINMKFKLSEFFSNRLTGLNEENDEPIIEEFFQDNQSFSRVSKYRLSYKSKDTAEVNNHRGNTIEDEKMASNGMGFELVRAYFQAGSNWLTLPIMILTVILTQVSISGTDYWISYWTNMEEVRGKMKNMSFLNNSSLYGDYVNNTFFSTFTQLDEQGLLSKIDAIYIYTFCLVTCITLCFIRNFVFLKICMKANRKIHDSMFDKFLYTPMSFFHANPAGRILNRFSNDIGTMDYLLPAHTMDSLHVLLTLTGILILIIIVNHYMLIVVILIGVPYFYIVRFYRNTIQNIKRIEGVAKSPILSHVTATLLGLATIRSNGEKMADQLQQEFGRHQNVHTGVWFLLISAGMTFSLLLDVCSSSFIAILSFTLVFSKAGSIIGGYVGLAISQSLILTGLIQHGVKQTARTVEYMTAFERVRQYSNLPKEKPLFSEHQISPNWPENGRLEMKQVSMSYREDQPLALKDINIVIEAGWKVGIVGRTGAGKSSLVATLFRLSNVDGEILIDGVDTGLVGLQDLRSRISIIPQDPVLFTESLRYNLDPFGNFQDFELLSALQEVEIGNFRLDQRVASGGSNFSVGQRQLICLARTILRNNRILVLDEATSNIDSHTDSLIQKTIRSRFASCTVLTIAHRLNTIMDYDRVMVMDRGMIVEFGIPYELLENNPNGHFSMMIKRTGARMADNLIQIAKNEYERKFTEQINQETSNTKV